MFLKVRTVSANAPNRGHSSWMHIVFTSLQRGRFLYLKKKKIGDKIQFERDSPIVYIFFLKQHVPHFFLNHSYVTRIYSPPGSNEDIFPQPPFFHKIHLHWHVEKWKNSGGRVFTDFSRNCQHTFCYSQSSGKMSRLVNIFENPLALTCRKMENFWW